MLTHVDLFSGIGGFTLATQWAGFRTVVFCEIDEFCQAILKARFGARIVTDSKGTGQLRAKQLENSSQSKRGSCTDDVIKKNKEFGTVADTEGNKTQPTKQKRFHAKFSGQNRIPIISDIRDFEGTKWRGATLLTGGFPCQPFSVAGKRGGKEDNRYLWPEMFRVIKEAKPRWVLGENVTGIVNMALEQVCLDLESEGYEVQPIIIPACAVNAPHRRDRVWILGRRKDVDDSEGGGRGVRHSKYKQKNKREVNALANTDSDAPDPDRKGLQRCGKSEQYTRKCLIGQEDWEISWPEVATRLCRVDDGIPSRVDRLKCLGNAIVPAVAFQIIKGIAEIEKGGRQ